MAQKPTRGLKWRKCDFHVHTPASHDFVDDNVTADEIVAKAIAEGLDAIAVTDHNTGDWIDLVKDAAKGTSLKIFPGVEITCSAGTKGIHLLAIFDPSKGKEDVNGLLDAIGITHKMREKGNQSTTIVPEKSIIEVVEAINKREGIPVPAHTNSSKGASNDMRGQNRIQFFQSPHIIAVEATDLEKEGKTTKDWFDGTDKDLPKLAVYQASDNQILDGDGHCVENIGSRFSYFKLDVINLEGLRQCFVHPDVRITTKLEEQNNPRILSLKVNGDGFLGSQTINLHEGLNCIIGGKGVGKSLLVEFIRFGMCAASNNNSLREDHNGKLDKQLGKGNSVEIVYQHASGTKYSIKRIYQGKSQPSDVECYNLDINELFEGDVAEVFPVLAYSQTEVIKIAEDKGAQLELVDRFIDESAHKEEISELITLLQKNDRNLVGAIQAEERLEQTQLDIKTISEQIREIDKLVRNELFDKMKVVEAKKLMLGRQADELPTIKKYILGWQNIISNHKSIELPESDAEDKELVAHQQLVTNQLKSIATILETLLSDIDSTIGRSKTIVSRWLPAFTKLKNEYDQLIIAQGGDQEQMESKRRDLENRKAKLLEAESADAEQAHSLNSVRTTRDQLLNQLQNAYKAYYELRANKFKELSNASDGRLQLDLNYAHDQSEYAKKLSELLKGGSDVSTTLRKRISDNIQAREFVELVLNNDQEKISEKASITLPNANKVIAKLKSRELSEILKLQYAYQPDDVPEIKYQKSGGQFAPLNELSVGQKCTALLIIALAEGSIPIIIDQPEDALDIVSVWDDVASKLLEYKSFRQFILTTHNSSVAVSADSDQFIVLNADATQATVTTHGAIDRDEVKQAVIDHLEGGDHSYALRHSKYRKHR